MLESAWHAFGIYGIVRGRGDILPGRDRRVCKRCASQDSQPHGARTSDRTDRHGWPVWRLPVRIRWPVSAIRNGAGGIGAVLGTFGGYQVRTRLVRALKVKDIFVAIPEDLVAVGLACFFVWVR